MHSIGCIVPSYGRPSLLLKFVNSFFNSLKDKNIHKIYCYIDYDDPLIDEYKKIKIYGVFIFFGPHIGAPKTFNFLASKVKEDLIMMGNDDLFIDQNSKYWDQTLDNYYKTLKDKYVVVFFNDQINFEKHCAFPIITKEWYELIGYTYPNFIFGHNDNWIFSIGCMLNRVKYFENIIVNHESVLNDKFPLNDSTYNRNSVFGKVFIDYLLFSLTFLLRFLKYLKIKRVLKSKVIFNDYNFFHVEKDNLKMVFLLLIKIIKNPFLINKSLR